ncbi:uncharacterized protein LOC128014850 [Carassius gibelio]|uniref:uncharacterized protein LOC128014850 n=1 Tax=Carassius gibelio TaxID=101364 RepID=UPI002278BDE2|nr:uncharacterized protein LOC128014850 [Carassius gibelio]
MAAKQSDLGWDNTFTAGRGRGSLLNTPDRAKLFEDPEYCSTGRGRGIGLSPDDGVQMCGSPIAAASNYEFAPQESEMSGQMSNLIRQIGIEIGQSIRESMMRPDFSNHPSARKLQEGVSGHVTDPSNTTVIDASKMNLILRAEVSAPPHFRGDSSDKYSVLEWEDMMRVYLNKLDVTESEMVDEIMNRVMGRARDVMRVWLRNGSTTPTVDSVFSVLKQHFGDQSSSGIPLADFYSVRPYPRESAWDFWIRLNKAADVAEQSLRWEGRSLDNRSKEVAVMFIRNCPDKELAFVFKSKPVQSWNASEVQEQLDELLRERKLTNHTVKQFTTVVSEPDVDVPVSSSKSEQGGGVADENALDKVLSLLEKTLVCNTQSVRGPWPKRTGNKIRECRVCQSGEHSTTAHCKMYNLCFKCFAAGHASYNCDSHRVTSRVGSGQHDRVASQGN